MSKLKVSQIELNFIQLLFAQCISILFTVISFIYLLCSHFSYIANLPPNLSKSQVSSVRKNLKVCYPPLDTWDILNLQKTFRKCPRRFICFRFTAFFLGLVVLVFRNKKINPVKRYYSATLLLSFWCGFMLSESSSHYLKCQFFSFLNFEAGY